MQDYKIVDWIVECGFSVGFSGVFTLNLYPRDGPGCHISFFEKTGVHLERFYKLVVVDRALGNVPIDSFLGRGRTLEDEPRTISAFMDRAVSSLRWKIRS